MKILLIRIKNNLSVGTSMWVMEMLESIHQGDSNKWSNIGFDEEIIHRVDWSSFYTPNLELCTWYLPPPMNSRASQYTVKSRYLEVDGTIFYKFKLPEVQTNLHFALFELVKKSPTPNYCWRKQSFFLFYSKDASNFAEFEISEFEISRFDCKWRYYRYRMID